MNKVSTFVMGAAIGCAVGSLAALALAPKSGAETLGSVAERAGSLGSGIVNFAQEKIKGTSGSASDPSADELREKIEAARQRIAAQVAQQEA